MKTILHPLIVVLAILAVPATNLPAQALNLLHNLDQSPQGRLLLVGNRIYGTTSSGGAIGAGTVYAVNTDGTAFTNLYVFTSAGNPNANGYSPQGGVLFSDGTLYGTTYAGGLGYGGNVFSINTNGGNFNIVHTFSIFSGPGLDPVGSLIIAGGTLYGTTYVDYGGTAFSVNTDGSNFQNFFSFLPDTNGVYRYGENPAAGVVLSGSGLPTKPATYGTNAVYGTTVRGGTSGAGVIYGVSTDSSFPFAFFNVLHDFTALTGGANEDGYAPFCDLVFSEGKLYGVASKGGWAGKGTLFSVQTDGTNFTVLHAFTGGYLDGGTPTSGMVLAGKTLYGLTTEGGQHLAGTLFSINTDGSGYTTLCPLPYYQNDGTLQGGMILSGCTLYFTAGNQLFSYVIAPVISSFNWQGTSLVLNITNGVANCAYTVLMSTDLTSPPGQWTPIATNIPTLAGNFTIAVSNAVDRTISPRYFTVRSQ